MKSKSIIFVEIQSDGEATRPNGSDRRCISTGFLAMESS